MVRFDTRFRVRVSVRVNYFRDSFTADFLDITARTAHD